MMPDEAPSQMGRVHTVLTHTRYSYFLSVSNLRTEVSCEMNMFNCEDSREAMVLLRLRNLFRDKIVWISIMDLV